MAKALARSSSTTQHTGSRLPLQRAQQQWLKSQTHGQQVQQTTHGPLLRQLKQCRPCRCSSSSRRRTCGGQQAAGANGQQLVREVAVKEGKWAQRLQQQR
jgi:hypothetical protein